MTDVNGDIAGSIWIQQTSTNNKPSITSVSVGVSRLFHTCIEPGLPSASMDGAKADVAHGKEVILEVLRDEVPSPALMNLLQSV